LRKTLSYLVTGIGIVLITFLPTACNKKKIEVQYKSYDLPVKDFVNSIRFRSDSTWYVTAGVIGSKGYILKSTDLGDSWHIIFSNNTGHDIYDLLFLNDSSIMAGSDYLDYYYSSDKGNNWTFVYRDPWMLEELGVSMERFYHANDSVVFILGGIRYGNGMIVRSTDDSKNWQQTNYKQDMQGIHFNGETGYICGHGIVLKTIDWGNHFDTLKIRDENFVAISAITDEVVVLTANSGKIFRSTDGGEIWNKVYQKSVLGNRSSLRDMQFLDNNTGYAIGVNGLVLKSIDAGISWNRITNLPKVNYKRIYISPQKEVFLTGENGTLISFFGL
jgi:Photosynthesis system II assembly factor YCF48